MRIRLHLQFLQRLSQHRFSKMEKARETRLSFTTTCFALRLPRVSPSKSQQKYRLKDRHFALRLPSRRRDQLALQAAADLWRALCDPRSLIGFGEWATSCHRPFTKPGVLLCFSAMLSLTMCGMLAVLGLSTRSPRLGAGSVPLSLHPCHYQAYKRLKLCTEQ